MFALFSLGFLHMLNKSDCMSQGHSSFSSVLVNQFIPGMNWFPVLSEFVWGLVLGLGLIFFSYRKV